MTENVMLELDAEMLARARAAQIDLSALLARALRRELPLVSDIERKRAADEWCAQNKEEVDSYNEFVEKHGLFSDGVRMF
jgi:antitoxin CcdA